MLENKISSSWKDTLWIDLTGDKDYLVLKKPIRVEKKQDEFYVKEFELSIPLNYNLNQIKKRISERFKELITTPTSKEDERYKKLWEKIIDIVDCDAWWENHHKGSSRLFKLTEGKDKKRFIQLVNSTNKTIPKRQKEYFNNLPLGVYKGSMKYSGGNRIKSIDEIYPVNFEW
jgi:hypothetical protein